MIGFFCQDSYLEGMVDAIVAMRQVIQESIAKGHVTAEQAKPFLAMVEGAESALMITVEQQGAVN